MRPWLLVGELSSREGSLSSKFLRSLRITENTIKASKGKLANDVIHISLAKVSNITITL